MKRSYYKITAASALALSMAGLGVHCAQAAEQAPASGKAQVTAEVSGIPSAKDEQKISEKGFEALNDAHLARVAINDGYVDNARTLLTDAKKLLGEVKKEDKPVTVTTDIKVGQKDVEHETTTKQVDLIPVISELQVVEGFQDGKQPAADKNAPKTTNAKAQNKDKTQAANQQSNSDRAQARVDALAKAKEHIKNGDRGAAVKELKLVDLTLVTRVINMPLNETTDHVVSALKLLDEGKLHEANLELKKVQDGLVMTANVVHEPTDKQAQGSTTEIAPKAAKAG